MTQLYRDSFDMREKEDLTLEIDNRSALQHCLYLNENCYRVGSKVQSMIIDHLSLLKTTLFNQLAIQMAVPDILFHPRGVIVKNFHKLIQEPEGEKDETQKASFFVQMKDDLLPEYFSEEQMIINKEKF